MNKTTIQMFKQKNKTVVLACLKIVEDITIDRH